MCRDSKETGETAMKRVKVGIIILLCLILLSGSTAFLVRHETKKLLLQLDYLEWLVEEKPLEETGKAFSDFEAQWERSKVLLNAMVWRDKVLQVDMTIAHLDSMRETDCDELKSEISETRMWLERLWSDEKPSLRNIL